MAPRAATAENNKQQPETSPLDTSQPPTTQDAPEDVRPSKKSRILSPFTQELAENVREDSVAKAEDLKSEQKRPRDSKAETEVDELEGVRPSKQPRRTPPSEHELTEGSLQKYTIAAADEPQGVHHSEEPQELLPSKDQLSERNLRIFNGEERSSSQRSTTAASEVTQDTNRTPRSSGTALYRYTHLAAAEVYIHTKPPDNIQNAIDVIIQAKPSGERLTQLNAISHVFHNGCARAVQAAIGEDDCVDLFLDVLKAMNYNNICLRAKADWREELKPKIQQSGLNLSFISLNFTAGNQQQEAGDASSPPSKRQRQLASQSYRPPQTPLINAANSTRVNKPPPAPRQKEGHRSLIKTPQPAISVGIQRTNLVSALSLQDLNNTRVKQFIAELQREMVYREPDGLQEPMLISVPAPRASDLAFPFAVVEGKAYSTGRQVFEAENQAAVSGACGLKIQLCLDELAKAAPTSSNVESLNDQPPLFFSVCTQGPYYELWGHWTQVEDGVRKFNQTLLEVCNGVLPKTVDNLVIALDNVLRWGTGPFLDSVVERLGKVARKAKSW